LERLGRVFTILSDTLGPASFSAVSDYGTA
jgi:hypothetical protein